ncbi:hypothetical protein ACFCYO_27180, partial [Streptomyces sp. NPDC056308]
MSDDLQGIGPGCECAVVGGRLADPGWLVNTDPVQVLEVLGGVVGREEVLAAAVYRASARLHGNADAGVRRQLLALDAARYGDRGLAARITAVPVEGEPAAWWRVDWATGGMVTRQLRHTFTAHTSAVCAVATAVVDGRPVIVSGSRDKTVRVWDLTTGQQVGEPLTGHTSNVCAVATTVMDDRPIAVTGSWYGTARVWDLATSRPVDELLTGHTNGVYAVATAVVDDRPVAVTDSRHGTVGVWDLTTGRSVGEPLAGHTGSVLAVATGMVDGRPVAVTGSVDETVRVWDLTTGQPIG